MRSQDRREEGALACSGSSALTSGNHGEGKEERSAFVPGTLSKSCLIAMGSLGTKLTLSQSDPSAKIPEKFGKNPATEGTQNCR